MLKKIINECRFTLTLETKGSFIIRDGRYEKKKGCKEGASNIPISWGKLPDNINANMEEAVAFVRDHCYVPGTSLRGVIRSHAEKIVRSIKDENNPLCCDPFDRNTPSKISCSSRMDEPPATPPSERYKKICMICRLFGCTGIASRIQIHDSPSPKNGEVIMRDGIGIDRFTGGVASSSEEGKESAGANFRNMVLHGYTFQNEISIRNFEIWQLGLMAYVFRDLENEQIPIGFGKSKGFGRVKGTVNTVELTYYKDNQNQLKGIAELCDENEVKTYKLISIPIEPAIHLEQPSVSEWDSYRRKFLIETNPDNNITKSPFWGACAKVWNQAVKDGKFKTIPELKGDEENG
jgi:CRISPR-associated RAMP protein (TIGR02581 family)